MCLSEQDREFKVQAGRDHVISPNRQMGGRKKRRGKRGKQEKGAGREKADTQKLQRTTTDTTRLQHSCEMGDAAEWRTADATAMRAEGRRAEKGRDMTLARIPFRRDHWVQFGKYKKPIPLCFSAENIWLRVSP
ncbi:hypothetical protein WR25_10847 [Diploscapter pachys]|uniref:Uncharacterized protein n=1 Tax=Diploscapter pachys TaxID=2018661 RepID=A0A2A2LBW0_9BILA|nr:hypothetical protein WR25_10847 [Diploscapter pachys]